MNIDGKEIDGNNPCYIVSEVGINANSSVDIAKQLIDVAKLAGCNAVKFQKRTIELQYTAEELAQPRISPFGTTNGDLKRALEFDYKAYQEIDRYFKEIGMTWLASAWDKPSIDFLEQFDIPVYKIPSARNNDIELIEHIERTGKPIILSTGMASIMEIENIVQSTNVNKLALLVCTASYPTKLSDLHLYRIDTLRTLYPDNVVGYSGHEVGLWSTLCAVAMGAQIIERHISLDRSLFGSDQAASLEPMALHKLVREIRDFEIAAGSYELGMLPCEVEVARKLKRKSA